MKLPVAEQVPFLLLTTSSRRRCSSSCQYPPPTRVSWQVRVSQLLLWLGAPCLPFMWLLNIGMFYSAYTSADCHPLVKRNVRASFIGVMLWAVLAMAWMFYYRAHRDSMQACSFAVMWSYLWGGGSG